jgi:WD40 repeat protein
MKSPQSVSNAALRTVRTIWQTVSTHKVIATALILFAAGIVTLVLSWRPVITPPRVALANSKDYLTVGLGFSPDGKTFAGVSEYVDENRRGMWGGPVRLWDVQAGQERATLLDNHTRLADIAFSPNGDLLATEDGNGGLKLWDVNTGKEWAAFEVSRIETISHWRPNFAFSPDGQALAFEMRSESGVTLWDLAEKRERALLAGGSRPLVFSPDSRILATALGQSIRCWDVATGKELATAHGPPVQALSVAFAPVAFAPDGRTLATASRKQSDEDHPLFQVVLWNVSDGAQIAAWDTEVEVRFSLSFSPDGQVLTGHTADLKPPCWNMSDLTLAPPTNSSRSRSVAPISPDQKTCALPGPTGEIILWDLPRGKIKSVLSPRDLVWTDGAVAFSPDSQSLAYGFSPNENDDWLRRLTYGVLSSPRRISAVPESSGIKLLDVATGKVLATFEGSHYGEFSPDGKMWAMHGTDGTIQIWDVPARSGIWPIVLWSIFGLLAAAIICWWLRRTYRRAQDRADLTSISPGTVASP